MRIETLDSFLLELPLPRSILSGSTAHDGGPIDKIFMPVVSLRTDSGLRGMGYGWCLLGGGQAMLAALRHDLAPMLIGEDPLDHERLWWKMYSGQQSVGRHGVVIQAQSVIDLALWDIKGKAAGMPLYKLLGGVCEKSPVYGSDGGWLHMSVEEIVEASHEYLAAGMLGIKLKVGHDDFCVDVARVRAVRQALGDKVWIAIDANQKWDFPTALRAGREFEQLDCAWFEEPMLCEDVEGHSRLAAKLDIPIALGETLGSRFEIDAYLKADAVEIVQPDLTHVGGITEWCKIAAICSTARRPLAPHLMMETSVHLACGLPGVQCVEYMPWLGGAFEEPLELKDGCLVPPESPGLGVEVSQAAIDRYRIA